MTYHFRCKMKEEKILKLIAEMRKLMPVYKKVDRKINKDFHSISANYYLDCLEKAIIAIKNKKDEENPLKYI